jgi:hypothetical protein
VLEPGLCPAREADPRRWHVYADEVRDNELQPVLAHQWTFAGGVVLTSGISAQGG